MFHYGSHSYRQERADDGLDVNTVQYVHRKNFDWNFEQKLEAEIMLKAAHITWHSPVKFGDNLLIESQVTRWGNSSFDITTNGFVSSKCAFEAIVSYVCVDPVDYKPMGIPELLKTHLQVS